jgi:methyl-accepting chemotaxis protein
VIDIIATCGSVQQLDDDKMAAIMIRILWLALSLPFILAQRTNATTKATSATSASAGTLQTPPDVRLDVPNLSVGRIELDVDNLEADINLNANVAQLVSINAGVKVSIQQVNLTIVDVKAQLDLIVRLGHLVDIVNRVFESLDLNPLLISTIGNVTNLLEPIVGSVDGLLGSITNGGTTLNFVVDNLGNIVQEVGGVSTIVGNYVQNMTDIGQVKQLGNGLVQKTFSYSPLNALVNIVFNSAGQVVQAAVAKATGGTNSPSSTTAQATTTPTTNARRRK